MNSSQPLLLLSSSQQPLLTDRMESQWWKKAGSEQRAQDGHIGGANGKSSVVCLEPFNTVAVFLYRVMDGIASRVCAVRVERKRRDTTCVYQSSQDRDKQTNELVDQ